MIKQDSKTPYGECSEEQISEMLNEINGIDADFSEGLQQSADAARDAPEDDSDIEARYGDDGWRQYYNGTCVPRDKSVRERALSASQAASKEYVAKRRSDRLRIQRMAFNQNFIKMSDEIGNDNIKALVSLLVSEHTRLSERYGDYINTRLTALLLPLIPDCIRRCWDEYRNSVRPCPGFLYGAESDSGKRLTFWATPDIPYYFRQNDECELIKRNRPELLLPIDNAVFSYHEQRTKRTEKEIKYASTILQKGVSTYFDLLKLNPFWFETLYNHLKNENV